MWLYSGWLYKKTDTFSWPVMLGQHPGYVHRYTISFETGKMNADFSDLRFSKTAGYPIGGTIPSTEIAKDYNIVSYVESTSAIVDVYIGILNAGSSYDVSMYYGNADGTDESDPDGVYLFYDNFNDDEIDTDKWPDIVSGDRKSVV